MTGFKWPWSHQDNTRKAFFGLPRINEEVKIWVQIGWHEYWLLAIKLLSLNAFIFFSYVFEPGIQIIGSLLWLLTYAWVYVNGAIFIFCEILEFFNVMFVFLWIPYFNLVIEQKSLIFYESFWIEPVPYLLRFLKSIASLLLLISELETRWTKIEI